MFKHISRRGFWLQSIAPSISGSWVQCHAPAILSSSLSVLLDGLSARDLEGVSMDYGCSDRCSCNPLRTKGWQRGLQIWQWLWGGRTPLTQSIEGALWCGGCLVTRCSWSLSYFHTAASWVLVVKHRYFYGFAIFFSPMHTAVLNTFFVSIQWNLQTWVPQCPSLGEALNSLTLYWQRDVL